MNERTFDKPWQRWPLWSVGGGLLAIGAVGAVFDPTDFFRSYLIAFTFWLGVALGNLVVWMIHNLTGGAWGYAMRRLLEASSRTLPLLAILFVPLALGMEHVFPWATTETMHEPALDEKRVLYLNVPFFLGRAALYFAGWLLIAWLLNRHARAEVIDEATSERLQAVSGPGLVFHGLAVTFAAIDWVMSLEPQWYSTIFGAVLGMDQVLTGYALSLAVLAWLADKTELGDAIPRDVWNDLGNLLLAFVMLWTYMGLSQFLVIWSGNLPEETTWYLARGGSWLALIALLALLLFAAPFVLLLSRDIKRDPRKLGILAAAIAGLSALYHFWLIAPAFSPGHFYVRWTDPVLLAGMGVLWLAEFARQFEHGPLMPPLAPAVGKAVSHA